MTGWLTRPAVLATGFLAAALLVLAGLGWTTFTALEAEAGQRVATAQADRANRERLALWRLDGFVLPVVARENARPFDHYAAPSPVAAEPHPGWVLMHVQLDPARGWSSPQAVGPSVRLEQLKDVLAPDEAVPLFAEAPAAAPPDPPANRPEPARPGMTEPTATPAGPPQQVLPPADYARRQQNTAENLNPPAQPTLQVAKPITRPTDTVGLARALEMAKDRPQPTPPPGVHLGPMRAVWAAGAGGDLLFLVRPVQQGTRRLYQAVWLDWPALRSALAGQMADLLPAAELRPVKTSVTSERSMTVLPVELDPGPAPLDPPGWTPLRTGLALAWAATLLALAAVAAGGHAVVQLADRRVRFVSAVTHELRTPLTSLRLYLDLLAGGLVTDPAKRQEYLVTLTGEADRLHRLIENVLDFARLERRAVRANCRPVPVDELVTEAVGVWADRLSADGKELVVNSAVAKGQRVQTDPRVAGQVLANLLDNARKYSRGAADPRVTLTVTPAGGRVAFEVADRGPGVPAADRAGLFRPFRRGRSVETVGGAGLGLALAAQWAGLLGGRLAYRPADGGVGACFRLELPAAGTG